MDVVCADGVMKRSLSELAVKKAAGAVGAYVDGAALHDGGSLDQHFDAIDRLLLEHHVLFFRDQRMDPENLARLAARFGVPIPHGAYELADDTSVVQVLESTNEAPSKIELWHSDMTFAAQPPAVTLLYAEVVPEFGGDTLWANAAAAREALSPALETWLAGLTATHDFRTGFRESLAEPGGAERLADLVAANPPVSHPVIRAHPRSGKRALYVNALFTTHIDGLARHESDALLELLCSRIVADELTVRLSWQPGTLALWDNRTTQHKPVNDFHPQHRRMLRVTVA